MQIGNIPNVPVVTAPGVEKRTLQGLREKYEFEIISPMTAANAMQESYEIMLDCDLKGYHTEEDMQMIEFLWEVRNICVQ